ncbi:MAG: ABC transporter ATP-binding protein [Lachnospiraceae bacterium]|nr:ABC transporter ATP-binding protein [Lachnospiraceae bacterium]
MKEPAITVKDLEITYKTVKKYSIKRNLLRMKPVETKKVEAVRGVSFEVEKGEILGIIGKNGSGKSTMLKALANIFSADAGTIDLHGNSISLLAIGVGFMGDLTGRENIMLSGLVLGFSEAEVEAHMDDIIAFADLGDFIDMPVRTYSSGMYSKLAFSVTAILETDIMLIDEVLSVGDESFKKKSYGKMKELISDGDRTVVIVSHNLGTLQELCDRVLWLNDGEVRMCGDTKEVLNAYREFMK